MQEKAEISRWNEELSQQIQTLTDKVTSSELKEIENEQKHDSEVMLKNVKILQDELVIHFIVSVGRGEGGDGSEECPAEFPCGEDKTGSRSI